MRSACRPKRRFLRGAFRTSARVLNAHGRKPNELAPNEAYVGRQTRNGWRKSKWANLFKISCDGDRADVIAMYRRWLLHRPDLLAALPELRGKDLVCRCAPKTCYGDVLLELANKYVSTITSR